jgi:Uma2 family endonuclease
MALSAEEYPYINVEDYLALDSAAESVRYEYIDGRLRMLAGGSPDHSIIATNLASILTQVLCKKPCIVYNLDVHFKISEYRYLHPDISVSCDPRDKNRKENIQYPRLIVEVLSPSTERTDKGEKLDFYLEYPSIEEYVLIDSQRKFAEVYHRDSDTWTSRIYKAGSVMQLQCVELEIALDELYEKTSLEGDNTLLY